MNFKVITTQPKSDLYLTAFAKTIGNVSDTDTHKRMKQAVIYGTKYFSALHFEPDRKLTYEQLQLKFQMVDVVKKMMSKLKVSEFINLFPIKKEYNGDKFGWKDYFFTVDKLKEYNQDKPIGEQVDDLLWDYTNDDICAFMVQTLCTASKLRKFQGEMGIAEQWAIENGISTVTVNEKAGYVMDNTSHKTKPYRKPVPEYLSVVK